MLDKPWARYVGLSLLILVIMAAALLFMGRLPFCKCGIVRLWSGDINSNQNSQQFFDPYTFTHIIHGTLLYFLLWLAAGKRLSVGMRLVCAVALESAWEIIENTDFVINRYRTATISLDYYGDSVLNSVMDVVAMIAGFAIAARVRVMVAVAVTIGTDLLLLVFIRDSFVLNIIMLIHPVEAIRIWQGR